MNILNELRRRFAAAAPSGADADAFAAAVRPSTDPKFGDYQANGCMGLKAVLGKPPRTLAQEVADRADLLPLANPPEIAGPGFLNVRLRDEWMAQTLASMIGDERLGLERVMQPLSVVIDYSSPNVAKPMHVGHIRSTVIGDSLARVFRVLGHSVVRDNHLGDWGAQFGMILWGWKNHADQSAFQADPVAELARLYRLVQGKIKAGEDLETRFGKLFALEREGKLNEASALFEKLAHDPIVSRVQVDATIDEARTIAEAARLETVRLHEGDAENCRLWQQFMPHCRGALDEIYQRLGVEFDVQLGESHYNPMLAAVVADLVAKGLATESEGATVVFVQGFNAPFIIRKRDGAFNYATTDLATIQYRVATWNPDLILYVVDHRQGDHFKLLFEVARRWGHTRPRFEHVAFGTILGPDRRPFKTREGDTVGLESLLDEAVARAREVVDQNSPDLPPEERARVAEIVGLGAIKYADLSQNRLSDYVFDWDKMLALNGNTAAYMQYAHARIRSIFRKGNVDAEALSARRPSIVLGHSSERALGLLMLRLPEAVEQTALELKPNILTDYLFALANAYSTFYDSCPVLQAESDQARDSRLALCELTARALKLGLGLLGIEVVDRM